MKSWLTTRDVADALSIHPVTVRRCLEDGRIHGHKQGPHWRVHPDVPELVLTGKDTREPCGCARVTPLRAVRSA